jgi:hypothetical protein
MKASLARFGVLAAIGLGVAAAVVLINLVLHLSTTVAPEWLPYRAAGAGYANDIAQRVESVEQQYQDGRLHDQKYFCALIGLSGLREAIDLKVMAQANPNCRYMGLGGAGVAMDTIAEESRSFFTSKLRPDVAVVGIADFLLVKPAPPGAAGADGSPWLAALRDGRVRDLARMARDWLWFVERRRDVNTAVEEVLIVCKLSVLRFLGANAAAQQNPLADPWREMIRNEVPEHASEAALRAGIAGYEARRWYDPASYERQRIQLQAQALNDVVRNLRSRGTNVIVAVMPQHSRLRARLPAVAMNTLKSGMDEAFGASAPPLLDLREAVPDTGFADIAHVNTEGRRIVSQRIAAQIDSVLPRGKPPLMQGP